MCYPCKILYCKDLYPKPFTSKSLSFLSERVGPSQLMKQCTGNTNSQVINKLPDGHVSSPVQPWTFVTYAQNMQVMGPLQVSDHMVDKAPYWNANCHWDILNEARLFKFSLI